MKINHNFHYLKHLATHVLYFIINLERKQTSLVRIIIINYNILILEILYKLKKQFFQFF